MATYRKGYRATDTALYRKLRRLEGAAVDVRLMSGVTYRNVRVLEVSRGVVTLRGAAFRKGFEVFPINDVARVDLAVDGGA